jgi:hypothetical protein
MILRCLTSNVRNAAARTLLFVKMKIAVIIGSASAIIADIMMRRICKDIMWF